ncbi:MAG TPA: hypothetical protein VK866_13800 [Acidimicrobiales bacterium]|nr:hypothetical protein [Acidimicrobiales bacterium]
MTRYRCPEFAVTGIELQIIEEEAQREEALRQGWPREARAHDAEIRRLWNELAEVTSELVDASPHVAA